MKSILIALFVVIALITSLCFAQETGSSDPCVEAECSRLRTEIDRLWEVMSAFQEENSALAAETRTVYKEIAESLAVIRERVSRTEVKASVWGALGGLIPALGLLFAYNIRIINNRTRHNKKK